MVAFPRFSPLSPLVPPLGAIIAGAAVAVVFATMPVATMEEWAWRSGLPALVAAAAPPLGTTARAVLAIGGAALTGAVAWSVLYLLFGSDGLLAPRTRVDAPPAVRRADAHPDAPPRRPMTAAEMGTPLMDVAAAPVQRPAPEWTLPTDLDQPMSAFDPAAIPDVPLPRPAKVAPMPRAVLAPGERIDTYVLARPPATVPPPRRPRGDTPAPALSKPSIDALLARLEAHAAQRMGGMTQAAE
jgi:hypothetical protein